MRVYGLEQQLGMEDRKRLEINGASYSSALEDDAVQQAWEKVRQALENLVPKQHALSKVSATEWEAGRSDRHEDMDPHQSGVTAVAAPAVEESVRSDTRLILIKRKQADERPMTELAPIGTEASSVAPEPVPTLLIPAPQPPPDSHAAPHPELPSLRGWPPQATVPATGHTTAAKRPVMPGTEMSLDQKNVESVNIEKSHLPFRRADRLQLNRRLLPALFMLVSAFLVAHTVNAVVEATLLHPVYQTMPDATAPPAEPDFRASQRSGQQSVQVILSRGLFLTAKDGTSTSSTGASAGPPLDVAKKVALRGIVMGGTGHARAILEDQSNKKQALYQVLQQIPDVGELVAIENKRVLFRQGTQEEWLELAMLADLEQARRIPPPPEFSQGRPHVISQSANSTGLADLKPMGLPAAAVPSAGSNRPVQIIDRRELSKTLSDIPFLLLQAQPVVSMIGGRFVGIRLEAVRAGGLYAQMGLQSDDVLKRFNGMELREPSMVITAFEQMKNEHRVKLDLVRNETPHTFTYEIR